MPTPAYDRVLLKLSGEAFAGRGGSVDVDTTTAMAREIAQVHADGVSLAIVVGGGNIWRGKTHEAAGMDRPTADYMGMLATVINALALQDSLERIGVASRVQTAIAMNAIAEPGPATRISPPTRPPRCAPSRSARKRSSKRPRSTASTAPTPSKTPPRPVSGSSTISRCWSSASRSWTRRH